MEIEWKWERWKLVHAQEPYHAARLKVDRNVNTFSRFVNSTYRYGTVFLPISISYPFGLAQSRDMGSHRVCSDTGSKKVCGLRLSRKCFEEYVMSLSSAVNYIYTTQLCSEKWGGKP